MKNDLEVLRPLLSCVPKYLQGERILDCLPGEKKAMCLSCGARDTMVMIRKHKKNCPWQAFWKAHDALRHMLGASNEEL